MTSTLQCSGLHRCNEMRTKPRYLSTVSRCVLLILLSACVTAQPRECYWCGPLAEQVHRSQRVQPCGGQLSTTACDPDYQYCAVVASSPPYVESRLCVKLYQDECYSVYCNSTKTWRMTCPCKGNLCNGPNTEREEEAFSVLKNLVAKTQSKISKRSSKIDTDDLMININTNNDVIATNTSISNHDMMQDNKTMKNDVMIDASNETEKLLNTTNSMTALPVKETENIVTGIIEPSKKENKVDEMQADQPLPDQSIHKEPQIETTPGKDINQIANKDNGDQMPIKIIMKKITSAETLQQSATIAMNNATTTMPSTTNSTAAANTTIKTNVTEQTKPKNSAVGICLHAILLLKWLIMYSCS